MIIAAIAFVAFLASVVGGVVWMIKQDTNRPDTEISLWAGRIALQMSKNMAPFMEKMGTSIKEANRAFAQLGRSFQAAAKKLEEQK